METGAASYSRSRPAVMRERFYILMGMAMLAIGLGSFAPSLLDHKDRKGPVTLALAFHGVIFAAWLFLFFLQSLLVSVNRTKLHRRLGWSGVALAIIMAFSGFDAILRMARRGYDLSGDLVHRPGDLERVLVFQWGDLAVFVLLTGLAVVFRRRPLVHRQLMLCATAGGALPAACDHLIGHTPWLREIPWPLSLVPITVLLAASGLHDYRSTGKVHPLSCWMPAGLAAFAMLRWFVVAPSGAWHRVVHWLINDLPR